MFKILKMFCILQMSYVNCLMTIQQNANDRVERVESIPVHGDDEIRIERIVNRADIDQNAIIRLDYNGLLSLSKCKLLNSDVMLYIQNMHKEDSPNQTPIVLIDFICIKREKEALSLDMKGNTQSGNKILFENVEIDDWNMLRLKESLNKIVNTEADYFLDKDITINLSTTPMEWSFTSYIFSLMRILNNVFCKVDVNVSRILANFKSDHSVVNNISTEIIDGVTYKVIEGVAYNLPLTLNLNPELKSELNVIQIEGDNSEFKGANGIVDKNDKNDYCSTTIISNSADQIVMFEKKENLFGSNIRFKYVNSGNELIERDDHGECKMPKAVFGSKGRSLAPLCMHQTLIFGGVNCIFKNVQLGDEIVDCKDDKCEKGEDCGFETDKCDEGHNCATLIFE